MTTDFGNDQQWDETKYKKDNKEFPTQFHFHGSSWPNHVLNA